MRCLCGYDIGWVTHYTKGLCPQCKRSLWLQAASRLRPNSAKIAEGLTRLSAVQCIHGQTWCMSRCGVELVQEGLSTGKRVWKPILEEERRAWFERILNDHAVLGPYPLTQ